MPFYKVLNLVFWVYKYMFSLLIYIIAYLLNRSVTFSSVPVSIGLFTLCLTLG